VGIVQVKRHVEGSILTSACAQKPVDDGRLRTTLGFRNHRDTEESAMRARCADSRDARQNVVTMKALVSEMER
jgi:hypothetical protein